MIKSPIIKAIILPATLLCAAAVSGQVNTLPVTTIDGKVYYYYTVAPKETVYSLQRKLQVSKDDIIRYNPSVAEGLKAGATLYFPYESVPQKMHPPRKPADMPTTTYTVRSGDTIYGLAKRFGITEEQLLELNPDITKKGLRADAVITVPANVEAAKPASTEGYVVRDNETFYSIAREHGITVAELEAANPDVTILRKGQVLTIPSNGETASAEPTEEPAVKAPVAESPVTESPESPEIADSATEVTPADDEMTIALILPFMLNQESPSKQALRFTEFYKGFLIAADSLRSSGKAIHIRAYDSAASVDSVRRILSDSALKDADVILAPDNAAEIAEIAAWGNSNDVKVFNAFAIKDESYLTNPAMMQANIPSAMMYDKAAEGVLDLLRDYTPVIIQRKGASGDKTDFIAALGSRLTAKGIKPIAIEFDGKLAPEDLDVLDPMGNYMMIPVTGKQAELNKILPGIAVWRDQKVTPGVRVFGFPEWTMFKGETLQNMHILNTTIFSRFTVDESSHRNNEFDRRFQRWYGNEMENEAPRQGLLGFDTGMYLIRLLLSDDDPSAMRYSGIQNDFYFTQVDGGGWVNNALTFINYRPSGTTEKTTR